jgi:NAD(P)-dependent dehydrogenase (short-subunit alcohol dehydrogenase family)
VPASGIIVQLANKTKIVEITTLDFIKGQLVTRTIRAAELIAGGIEKFVEDTPRTPTEPVHTIDTAGLVSSEAYQALIVDDLVKTMFPLGYPGHGRKCAEIALFLVTDRGKWITGQAFNVDGGTV